MFVSAFKNDNETLIDHRLQYLTSCISNLNAATTRGHLSSLPLPGMDVNQLITYQQNMKLQAEIAETLLQTEGSDPQDIKVPPHSFSNLEPSIHGHRLQ